MHVHSRTSTPHTDFVCSDFAATSVRMLIIMTYTVEVLGMFGVAGMHSTLATRSLANNNCVAFSTLRVWAVWERAVVPTLAVFITSMFVPAVNIVSPRIRTSSVNLLISFALVICSTHFHVH